MKKIEQYVNICSDCPYIRYDSYYSIGTDSGYNCFHPDSRRRRIVDDWQIDQYNEKVREAERLPLLPLTVEDPDPFTAPDWCPLEEDDVK